MDCTVYFADKTLIFTTEIPADEQYAVVTTDSGGISRDKVLKILEMHNCVAVVSPSPDAAFDAFEAEFTSVTAAGGIVVNELGEWLMIHRNGRWDLPKGHLEPGEELAQCAAREVAEETGVCAEVVRPLCDTLHAYYMHARWELKRTCWYELRVSACGELQPQTEEGIDRVAWCRPVEVAANLCDAFPTIRCVAEAMSK